MNLLVLVEGTALAPTTRAALAAAAAFPGARVIAAHAGGESAPAALAEAAALGAARLIDVADAALAGSDLVAVGRVLAQIARHVEAPVVLAGAAADDEGLGLAPAAVAHYLAAPYIAGVEAVEPDGDTSAIVSMRGGGMRRRLRVGLPVVLVVSRRARPVDANTAAAVERLDLATVGLSAAQIARRPDLRGVLERPKKKPTVVASADELIRAWLAD